MSKRRGFFSTFRNVLGGTVAIIIFAAGYYLITARTGATAEKPPRAGEKPAAMFVVDGTLETDEVDVSSKVPGRLAKLYVREGDYVKAGEVLGVLEAEEIDARHDQAEAGVRASEAQFDQSEIAVGLERDKATAQAGQARAGVDAAQAALGMARQKLAALERGARPQEIEMARQNVAAAQAAFNTAKKTYDRVKSLADEGVVAQQRADEVEMNYLRARAALTAAEAQLGMALEGPRAEEVAAAREQVRQAEAGLEAAQRSSDMATAALRMVDIRGKDVEAASQKVAASRGVLREVNAYKKQTKIVSPLTGRVSRRLSRAGEIVAPGYAILTVTRTDLFWVDVFVDEQNFAGRRVGDVVDVELPALGANVAGRISQILPAASFATRRATNENGTFDTRSVQVRITLKRSPEDAVSGLTARVHFGKSRR